MRSKLVLFEDGTPLRRGHEHHGTIAGTGRGAYSHWERYIFFAASDNTNPNTNGRAYSYAVDYSGQHKIIDDGRTLLSPPFYLQDGLCWGVVVVDNGDDPATTTPSTLRLYEDDRTLGPSHTIHNEIEQNGAGRYSHWRRYLYFSTSDASDPNTNGRLYTYELGDDVATGHTDRHQLRDHGRTPLNAPFSPQVGLCWGVAVADNGDDVQAETQSRLQLYEDNRPLGPSHTIHTEIEQNGAGRYSHWRQYLYFSTSDGSDPNTNGRLYDYELIGD